MPKLTEDTVVREGIVMGFIKHYTWGDCAEEFEIYPVEDWIKMTDKEAEKEARGAFHESGLAEDLNEVDWWY